jgi:putative glutamine amidotransferase
MVFGLMASSNVLEVGSMSSVIGINADIQTGAISKCVLAETYYESITESGGTPVVIPPMSDDLLKPLLLRLDGLVLVGGPDYFPSSYGESPVSQVSCVDQKRNEFDFRLARQALETVNLPILGICAGMQLLNIVTGGSLIQDLPSEFPDSIIDHSRVDDNPANSRWHKVFFEKGSRLERIYQSDEINVVTSHHQAVRKLGRGFKPTAFAYDGVLEGIELDGRRFVVGVQWHPERDIAGRSPLFTAFLASANSSSIAQNELNTAGGYVPLSSTNVLKV